MRLSVSEWTAPEWITNKNVRRSGASVLRKDN
jgi:hypothetical protein